MNVQDTSTHIVTYQTSQEVDRIDKLGPVLESAGYAYTYACGPRKKHGCVIAYRKLVFIKIADHTIFYDDIEINSVADAPDEHARKGSSFKTKNIGLISALRRLDATDQHAVVATTHLFWHPRYTYERARQAFLLIKSVLKFKIEHNLRATPTFIAGGRFRTRWSFLMLSSVAQPLLDLDFNFNPSDAAYSLLVRDPLTTDQKAEIAVSRVVHVTIDPSIPIADPKKAAAEDEEDGAVAESEGDDPDRVITNARRAGPKDGLLEPEELEEKFAELPVLRSAYDSWRGPAIARDRRFGERTVIPDGRHGAGDPMYTSFTHYWRATLGELKCNIFHLIADNRSCTDYIFMLEDNGIEKYEVLGVLEPPASEQLGMGLPRKGVCGSDHLSVRARIAWSLKPGVLELDQSK